MQHTSNILARWPKALQSYDFMIQHWPGRATVVPDTLFQLFRFEE
ncbi:unnamed protein product [Sphacelaria rigidula]